MSVIVSIYVAILFFILTPSILLRLPPNGSKWTVALVHAVVFGLIFYFTHKLVWRWGVSMEGFDSSGYHMSSTTTPPMMGYPTTTPPMMMGYATTTPPMMRGYPTTTPPMMMGYNTTTPPVSYPKLTSSSTTTTAPKSFY